MHGQDNSRIEDRIDREHARLLAQVGDTFAVYEDDRYRWLQTRDGILHSVMDKGAPERLLLPYTRAMMAALLFVDAPESVLMLGLGGASQARFLRRHFPNAPVTAWERDAEMVGIARRDFGLGDDDAVTVVTDDARNVIEFDGPPADLMLLDLFGAGGMAPWLRESGIYKSCRRYLSRRGVLAANLWIDADDEFLGALNGIQRAFDERTLLLTVPGYRNFVVLAFDAVPRLDFVSLHGRAAELGERTGIDYGALLAGMRECNYSDDVGFVL